jgi:anti-anti-sigma factor
MPQVSHVSDSTAQGSDAASSPFLCTWRAGYRAAWIHVAGRLDLATLPQLRQALREAVLHDRLVVLDLRDLTFIDSSAVHVILAAAGRAGLEGRRLMLARGPSQVDRMFTLTGACEQVLIFDLDPAEPAPALLHVA